MKDDQLFHELDTIAVIIPVFNSGKEAVHAIDSVIKQTLVTVSEIIVVDDGSTDNSALLLRSYCGNLAVPVRIFSIPNGGAANARNFGMQKSNCDFFAFLDSDDTWFSNKLEKQIPFFADPAVGMVGCLTTMGANKKGKSHSTNKYRDIGLRQQLFKNYFQTSSVIVRRSSIDAVGPFPIGQRYAEEGDLFNRVASRYRCILVQDALVDYHNGKNGFGASGLSSNLIAMEKGELANLLLVVKRGDYSRLIISVAILYSIVKFLRRVMIVSYRKLINFHKKTNLTKQEF